MYARKKENFGVKVASIAVGQCPHEYNSYFGRREVVVMGVIRFFVFSLVGVFSRFNKKVVKYVLVNE